MTKFERKQRPLLHTVYKNCIKLAKLRMENAELLKMNYGIEPEFDSTGLYIVKDINNE